MKLYNVTQNINNKSYVGVVLVIGNDQIVMLDGFLTNRKTNQYLAGIDRAVSYIHHNHLTNDDNELIVYGHKFGLNDPIKTEYTEKFLPNKRIVPNTSELTSFDSIVLKLAQQQINNVVNPFNLKQLTQKEKD